MTKKPGTGEPILALLFGLYLVLLAWTILWKLSVPWIGEAALLPHPIKLVPFLPSGDADASAPLEVVANILLFVPFGLYLELLAPSWRWWKAAGVFAGASATLEIAQHLLSTGSLDVSDVIANTAGGIAGLGLLVLARRGFTSRTATVMTRILVIGTLLALLAIGIFVASPLQYSAQHDVIVPRG